MNSLMRINVFRLNCPLINRYVSSYNSQLLQTPHVQQLTSEHTSPIDKSNIPDPLKHPDFFGVNKLFTVKQLFESRVHYGHKEGTLNPHMLPYIFGSRLGILIFDLDQTAARFRDALNFTAHIAFRSGIILFVSRNRQTLHLVERTAKECGEYSHCRYWKDGTFTDSEHVFQSVIRLPDLLIFTNTLNNVFEPHAAVRDSAKLLIPSVGIVDTNCDPTLITYPIPGNDDTPCSIELYCKLFKEAILLGKAKRKEMIQKYGEIPMSL